MRSLRTIPMMLVLATLPLTAQQAPPPRPAAPTAMPSTPRVPPLPDPTGWGTHILALGKAPDGALWVGTYGEGIYVLRPNATAWENLRSQRDTLARSISMDFVHAFAFVGSDVWYGTIGNGWGISRDNGRTWRNWTFAQLGPKWLYVAPNGIVNRGDTVFIGTADGIRWTSDRGATWGEISDSAGGLPNRYVLNLEAAARGPGLWVSTLRGLGTWGPGRRYVATTPPPTPILGDRIRAIHSVGARDAVVPAVLGGENCAGSMRPKRRQDDARWECMTLFRRGATASVRQMAACDGVVCAIATNIGALFTQRLGLALQSPAGTARSHDVYAAVAPAGRREAGDTIFGTACGFLGMQPTSCLVPGDTIGVPVPAAPRHQWFQRPIARVDQPYIDQTYRFGSTMGGFFQPHQGVEFNNPVGTTVSAVGAGTVVHAGPAEQGALTVAIRHDSLLQAAGGPYYIYSVYYHNSRLLVSNGQRVTRGQPIARVGSTGRATNDHLHLEVHASPVESTLAVLDPTNRYPPYATNPELWIEPMPGTGTVAGQVWDGAGRPVPQARIYGIVKPQPQETPFSFAETYGERNRPGPAYQEHFAVTDVPPGEYALGTMIDGRRVYKRVRVEAGKVSWVEFR